MTAPSSTGRSMSSVLGPRVLEGWSLYFPEEEFNEMDPRIQIIDILTNFFKENANQYINLDEVRVRSRVVFHYQRLKDDIPVGDFETVLRSEPHTVICCIGLAVYQTLLSMELPFEFAKVHIRFDGYTPLTPIKDLKSNLVEKFIAVRGNVVRVGAVRPLVVALTFECRKCGARIPRHFPDGRYALPTGCPTPNCRARNFEPDRASARTIDFQKIRLQEIMGSDHSDAGRIPRSVDCELTDDLVDSCIPGDVVTVVGVVKAFKADVSSSASKDKNKSLFLLYLDVKSINNVGGFRLGGSAGNSSSSSSASESVSSSSSATASKTSDLQQFSARDLEGIRRIASLQPHLFRALVHSLCPAIYGHELVKAGFCLALLGGVQKNIGDRSKLLTRGDPHLLVVGDPGLGKSQMLRAVSAVAPRAVYVSGSSSTNAGLTVSMVRDGGAGDYALEAGALVLADQGVCCIDEFDKMSADHQTLFEAMEQQSISIAKAGIVCTLSARTSVIAAANPVGGHYKYEWVYTDHLFSRAKTVNENLKISGALLSRFDLIFILLDRPDEARDQLLSEHVIAMHSGGKHGGAKAIAEALSSRHALEHSQASASSALESLEERLRLPASENDPIPAWLLRKYISYARKFVSPRLSPEAKAVLREFYLHLRKTSRSADATPITTRQLESMIRLTEARAKAELREEATEQDALDVVEIIKSSLADVLEDEHGQIDFRRGSRSSSKSKQATQFMKVLKREVEQGNRGTGGDDLFSEQDLYSIAKKINLVVDNFSEFVEALNEQGYLLKKGHRKYQVAI